MTVLKKLDGFGADTKEGIMRCAGNEALYLKLVNMVLSDKNFEALNKALNENDRNKAFEASHALKGVLSNLSLNPLSYPVSQLTELLRNNTDADYSIFLNEIKLQKNTLEKILNE